MGRGSRVKCAKCERKDTVVEEEICEKEKKEILCPKCRTGKSKPWQNWEVAAWPTETKMQQSSTQSKTLKGAADKEVRRMFKREVWLNIGVEKVDRYP